MAYGDGAAGHVESAWACRVRQLYGLKPLRAITVSDIVRAVLLVEERRIQSGQHSWLDVPLRTYQHARAVALDIGCPALVVARFDDVVLFADAAKIGRSGVLCGEDGQARVRLEVRKMSPVVFESRW